MIAFTNRRHCGLLPMFFDKTDERNARAQLHENYAHGGGFFEFHGFTLIDYKHNFERVRGNFKALQYPEDPPMLEIGRGQLREETIILFENSWVAIVQTDGSYVVARCD